jgi:hypothetical protein
MEEPRKVEIIPITCACKTREMTMRYTSDSRPPLTVTCQECRAEYPSNADAPTYMLDTTVADLDQFLKNTPEPVVVYTKAWPK